MATTRTKATRYKPHPLLEMERKTREKIAKDRGRTWDAWVRLAREGGPKDEKALRGWLRKEHGFASMHTYWLASEAVRDDGPDYGDPEPLVDALYSGDKASLRPLHEAVVDACLALGADVTVTACKTMVPVYRKHVFAELAPVDGAVEVRLALGDVSAKGRLSKAERMPGDRLTHRVEVRSKRDVDAELKGWLVAAYAQGAGKMTRSTEFEVPADFAKALKSSKRSSATWGSMTPAMRRDMVQWVTSAKQDDTRARRLATSIARLVEGKKRVY